MEENPLVVAYAQSLYERYRQLKNDYFNFFKAAQSIILPTNGDAFTCNITTRNNKVVRVASVIVVDDKINISVMNDNGAFRVLKPDEYDEMDVFPTIITTILNNDWKCKNI